MNTLARALELFREAYALQMSGNLDEAIALYKASIDVHPTAEAYTFLGWTYSFQGRLDAAIEECLKAIQVDPEFGNPYNDIGAYLIEQGEPNAAVPWLEMALRAPRYVSYHFAWFNLGRAYQAQSLITGAISSFEKALEVQPQYMPARRALDSARKMLH